MAETQYYQRCSINMPLTPAARLVAQQWARMALPRENQADDRERYVTNLMSKVSAPEIVSTELSDYNLVGPNINEKTDTLELYTLREDDSWEDHPTITERPNQSGIEDLLALWAPICADGMFMELATENRDIDTGYFRLIISGGRVIHDFPHLTWDDPLVIAKQALRDPTY